MKKYFCTECGIEIKVISKKKKDYFRESGRIYCNSLCSGIASRRFSSMTMKKTNSKYASQRMKKNNPSFKKDILNKMIDTKTLNGTLRLKPIIQGGNGRDTPLPVKMLNEYLGWELCYIFPTKLKSPYPNHYKLEIANPDKKICIEVDGNSSYSRKEQSIRKEEFLMHHGWKVIRFQNRDVLRNLDKCIEVIKNELDQN